MELLLYLSRLLNKSAILCYLGGFVKEKKSINFNIAIMIVATIVFVLCVGYIIYYYSIQYKTEYSYELLREENVDFVDTKIPVDFASIQKQNQDAYAWITIPDTQINYPIMQSEGEDDYYLQHTFERVKALPGSIYTEKINSKEFTDKNTIIYGHNMKNGTMFGELIRYKDEIFATEHPYIYIYTPTTTLKYQIFASYLTDNKHILTTYDFEDNDVYSKYLEEVAEMNTVKNLNISITSANKIITLSTCDSTNSKRWVVQAYLVE